jgi:hypothetical protein
VVRVVAAGQLLLRPSALDVTSGAVQAPALVSRRWVEVLFGAGGWW